MSTIAHGLAELRLKQTVDFLITESSTNSITLVDGAIEYSLGPLDVSHLDTTNLNNVLKRFNGSSEYRDIRIESTSATDDAIVLALYHKGLLESDNSAHDFKTGKEALAIIEDLQNELLHDVLFQNKFWLACQNPQNIPANVLYGMAIENYHFLYRESWFDTPVLSYPGNEAARLAMNRFYSEEYGHDELIFRSLEQMGITRENIRSVQPLPQTLALCNSLAYWAASDPLFFFSTLGVLEGKDMKIDSYIRAMEDASTIAESFIAPLREHALINIEGEHGSLTAEVFGALETISNQDLERILSRTKLFVELYDQFYTSVWDYYSDSSYPLVRIQA